MISFEDRIERAASDPTVVVEAPGFLAAFNDAGVLLPGDVYAAVGIAKLLGEEDEVAILAAALAVRGMRIGHVAVSLTTLQDSVFVEDGDSSKIDDLPWPSPKEWFLAIEQSVLVGDAESHRPLILDNGLLYLQRYYRYEKTTATLLLSRLEDPLSSLPTALEAQLDDLLSSDKQNQRSQQNRAARIALSGKLSVLVGGPGTGKTYTIAKMLQALARLSDRIFLRVALCAPTGKAAARLGEELAQVAGDEKDPVASGRLASVNVSTLHRLLGSDASGVRFRYDQLNLLPYDLVIVDEVSMVSLSMTARLLSALRPDTALVLAGEPFQLESIEVGTVLADLVGPCVRDRDLPVSKSAMAGRVITLDRVHRFRENSAIAAFAAAIRDGDVDTAIAVLSAGEEGLEWIFDRTIGAFDDLLDRVLAHRTQVVELACQVGNEEAALDSLAELAVLSAHRKGPNSVEEWRLNIEGQLLQRFPDLNRKGDWYPGRPVMITRNDRNLRLFNGDIGVAVQTSNGLRVAFRRDEVMVFPRSYLEEYEDVHALTVHKSQGSQFGEVVVSLPGTSSRLLTRELLYTAVTRASESVVVVGEQDVIRKAIEHKLERASGLEARLWE